MGIGCKELAFVAFLELSGFFVETFLCELRFLEIY
jgi:hypothetical protein